MTPPSPGFEALPSSVRVRNVNGRAVRSDGGFVLYWMLAARRPSHNFALDRAIDWARTLSKPLLVLEALRVDYPYASDRFHRFVFDGMLDNLRSFQGTPARYYPYVETRIGGGRGLIESLGNAAAVVVTDEYPCFFLPQAVAAAGRKLSVRLEAVDSNGILPLAAADRAFTAAVHFRRHMQRSLRAALLDWPAPRPLANLRLPETALPAGVRRRWPAATRSFLEDPRALAKLPIDHEVGAVTTRGGPVAGRRALRSFVSKRLQDYHLRHNHPDDRGTSRLSPYLHFGHLSPHEIFEAVMKRERWSPGRLAAIATAQREGWWGVGPGAEAFLDQLVVWRELAFNTCFKRPDDYDQYESLPAWALTTLKRHQSDRRPHLYRRAQFEGAATHDPLWNAAQREMVRTGWFHNYMRMLWGKKILEWSRTPHEALATMTAIMNRWSLDGRDPNSFAGYFWTLGRYDRPWPERPVYGTVRSMSSERAAQKVRATKYVRTFAAESPTVRRSARRVRRRRS